MKRALFGAAIAAFLISAPVPARSAEPAPGDACSPANAFIRSGGPEASGKVYFMTCQSGAWKLVLATDTLGEVGIGAATPQATLDVSGTNSILFPRGDGTNRPASPVNGMMRYNTSSGKFEAYQGGSWQDILTSASTGSTAWSSITNPTGNLSLSMGADTTTWTAGAATTGDVFTMTDTASDTGTGYLLNVKTAASSAMNPLHVGAKGTDALTVLANGNVGIGTTSPGYTLTLGGTGQLALPNGSSGTPSIIFPNNGGGANNAGLYSSGTNTVVIYGGGNVASFKGSGSTLANPSITLGNWGPSATFAIAAASGGSGNADRAGVNLLIGSGQSTGNGAAGAIIFQNTPAGASGTTANSAVETMRIDSSGNVGIGTTSPIAGLDVEVARTALAGVAYGGLYQQTLTAAANNDILTALYINPTFADAGKTGVSHNGLIVGSGNVGIGTTTPAGLLNISGAKSASSWTTTGIALATDAATYTDTSSAAAATITTRTANSFGAPTLASTNAITVTNAATLYVGGVPAAGLNTTISNPYALYVAGGGNSYFGTGTVYGGIFYGTSNGRLMFNDPNPRLEISNTVLHGSQDFLKFNETTLGREAANVMYIRNTTNGALAQALRVYNSYTDASNYERGVFDWLTTANTLRIGTEAAGTGTVRNIDLVGGNVGIGTTSPNALLDIGKDGTTAGTLRLESSVSGDYTQLQTSALATGAQTYTLPVAYPASSGYVLSSTTGGVMSWAASGGAAIGSTTQVAFNNGGTESGSSDFTWNDSTKTLTVDAANTTGATLKVGVSGSNANKLTIAPTTGASAPVSNIGAAAVLTSETTNSASFTDLTTAGPAVTITTGTTAIVTVTAQMSSGTVADGCAMGYAVSGATTTSASVTQSSSGGGAAQMISAKTAGDVYQMSATFYLSGLTAGSNVFAAKYERITSGTCTFVNRNILVTLP